ncbi:undecaprenyl diphosphate synthase family protein [Candidatus Woesearchaeota archaeon]|nr:undecaprenyl diphosphate synthase family protein [Candidatus Woesearchaeota archaeon]
MKHLAIHIKTESQDYDKIFGIVKNIIEKQTKKDISILTIGLPDIPEEKLIEFFKFYVRKEYLNKNKVKLSIIGKWYDLPSSLLDAIKQLMDETRDYDSYFLNFTINYDGQQEIVDACRILCRQIEAGKIDLEKVDKNSIKDNLYSSYFVPPDKIIATGSDMKTNGFLLWDSVDSEIVFTGKDFDSDVEKMI